MFILRLVFIIYSEARLHRVMLIKHIFKNDNIISP